MNKIYLDWGRRKPHVIIRPTNSPEQIEWVPEEITTEELTKLEPHEIYIETGCPYFVKYQLLQAGHRVYQIDGKITKWERTSLDLPKTDEIDATLIGMFEQSEPALFKELTEKDKQRLYLQFLVGQLDRYTRQCTRLKNTDSSLVAEFNKHDEYIEQSINFLEERKEQLLSRISPLTYDEMKLLKDIKGVGPVLIADICAWANPDDFHCLTDYLLTIGYKAIYKRNKQGKLVKMKKACRTKAKRTFWQITDSFVKQRTPYWRELYDKRKQEFKEKYPDYRPGKINGMAYNRVSTQFAKHVYKLFHEGQRLKTSNLGDS